MSGTEKDELKEGPAAQQPAHGDAIHKQSQGFSATDYREATSQENGRKAQGADVTDLKIVDPARTKDSKLEGSESKLEAKADDSWKQKPGAELDPIRKLRVLEEQTTKHERNLKKMDAELQSGSPDPHKLNDKLATATGDRSEAYKAEPKYVREMIDRFENGHLVRDMVQSGVMAGGGAGARAQFVIEMTRTRQYLESLKDEKTAVLKEAGLTPKQWTEMSQAPADGPAGGFWRTAFGDQQISLVKDGDSGLVKGLISNGSDAGKMVFMGSPNEDGTIEGTWYKDGGRDGKPVSISARSGVLTIEGEQTHIKMRTD